MNIISQIIEEKFPKANHTLYMDDLRIMTQSSEEMGTIHNEIKEIISGIGMEMNEKKSGMVLKNINKIPDGMQNIPIIEGEDLYKYLGVWQSDEINDIFNILTLLVVLNSCIIINTVKIHCRVNVTLYKIALLVCH